MMNKSSKINPCWFQVLSLEEAHDRIFGMVLLNDWSARDIQVLDPLQPHIHHSTFHSLRKT